MCRFFYLGLLLLSTLWTTEILSAAPSSGDSDVPFTPLTQKELAAIEGADQIIYNLYLKYRESDREKSAEYAELFLSAIDTSVACQPVASMCEELAEWLESEEFLFNEAIRWRERALDIYCKMNIDDKTASEEYHLSKLYYKKGEYHTALRKVFKAYDYFTEVKDSLYYMDCCNLLGAIYIECGNNEKAQDWFEKYGHMASLLNDGKREINALNNIAMITTSDKKAEELIKESIRLCRAIGDTSSIGSLLINYSTRKIWAGEMERAEEILREAEPLLQSIAERGEFWLNMGTIYASTGRNKEAEEAIKQTIQYYNRGDFENMKSYCLEELHKIYASSGKWHSAYSTLLSYDSLNKVHSGKEMYVELFMAQNEVDAKIREAAEQKRENTIVMIFTTSSMFLVIVLLVVLILFYKKKVHFKEQQNEIANNNALLEMKKMQQFQMDMLVKETIERLRKIGQENKATDIRSKINELCGELYRSKGQEEWKEVSRYIPEMQGEFMERLLKCHPDLSVNERRLCALLNLNLSTKEISSITHQNGKAVDMARWRLRKKLRITDKSVSLQEYLSQISW